MPGYRFKLLIPGYKFYINIEYTSIYSISIEGIYRSVYLERDCNMLQIIFVEYIYKYSVFHRIYL